VIIFLKFLKALHTVLFLAGYLAIAVVASVIDKGGKPGLGLGIIVTATTMAAVLGFGQIFVRARYKRALKQHEQTAAGAATAHPVTLSTQVSESYDHEAHIVWSLIRPAESAVMLSDAQRAFTVPGTPAGVGEQQCFIGRDGSVSLIEVVGEESPWWATTRTLSPAAPNTRQTYRLEPTVTGCTLTVGIVLEIEASAEWSPAHKAWWQTHTRQYLDRVKEILAAQHPGPPAL
jgi:hypothetical protein